MKSSEEIILEEVRAQYHRQLASWTELDHRSSNFLQLNGLMLTVVFIGLGFVYAELSVFLLAPLVISASFIVVFVLLLAVFVLRSTSVRETKVELDNDADVDGKEKDIMMSMIRAYNTAQQDVISKHNTRTRHMGHSVNTLLVGLLFLLAFIVLVFIQLIL